MDSIVPKVLRDRKDIFDSFVRLAQKNLGSIDIEITLENVLNHFTIQDVSGMSNPVFIVGRADKKIVIRFFLSATADFALENKVFEIASQKGYAPEMIETDSSTYRVEQFYHGGPLTHLSLADPAVYKQTMRLLCDFNYDIQLNALIQDKSLPKALEFIENGPSSWYWQAFF